MTAASRESVSDRPIAGTESSQPDDDTGPISENLDNQSQKSEGSDKVLARVVPEDQGGKQKVKPKSRAGHNFWYYLSSMGSGPVWVFTAMVVLRVACNTAQRKPLHRSLECVLPALTISGITTSCLAQVLGCGKSTKSGRRGWEMGWGICASWNVHSRNDRLLRWVRRIAEV